MGPKTMIGITLYFIATLLDWLLAIPAFLHMIYGSIRKRGKLSKSTLSGALAKDISGNVAYAGLLNDWFIKRGGYHYGKAGETISSATGKNWVASRLTWIGKGLAATLNLVDFANWKHGGHCWIAIDDKHYLETYPRPDWYHGIWWAVPFLGIAIGLIVGLLKLWLWIL